MIINDNRPGDERQRPLGLSFSAGAAVLGSAVSPMDDQPSPACSFGGFAVFITVAEVRKLHW